MNVGGWLADFYECINFFYPWFIKTEISLPVTVFEDGHVSHVTLLVTKWDDIFSGNQPHQFWTKVQCETLSPSSGNDVVGDQGPLNDTLQLLEHLKIKRTFVLASPYFNLLSLWREILCTDRWHSHGFTTCPNSRKNCAAQADPLV